MLGLFHAQGAAESDASVRLRVRSHVPGMTRDRAQAEEAGMKKAKPSGTLYYHLSNSCSRAQIPDEGFAFSAWQATSRLVAMHTVR